MNIFILDRDPRDAARQMCDKHGVKMVTETAQLLSTCHRLLDGEMYEERTAAGRRIKRWRLPDDREFSLYKASHVKHPCNIWLRESTSNYDWTYEHFIALCDVYEYRYNRTHKADIDFRGYLNRRPDNLKEGTLTEFAQAMPDECKQKDVVLAYRSYYNKFKSDIAKWKSGYIPEWFVMENDNGSIKVPA